MCDAKQKPLLSGSESGTAFLAATFDNHTTGFGGHTGEETKAAFAATVGGLECSFHFVYLIYKSLCF